MRLLEFPDKIVPYDVFLDDLATHIVRQLKKDSNDPDYVSQRKAYKMFGRRNVERWRKNGLVTPYKRPGKMEYKTSELRFLQRTEQDYLYGSDGKGAAD